MIKNYSKSLLILCLSAFTLSCQNYQSFDDKRKEGYKTLPKREDTWFIDKKDEFDPYGNLSRADYQGTLNTERNFVASDGPVTPKIKMPDLTDIIEQPEQENLVSDKLVSISVNENVPLKDVIIELARRAEVDVEIDKDISGGIILLQKISHFQRL